MEEEEDEALEQEDGEAQPGKKRLLVVAGAVLIVALGGYGGYTMLGGDDDEAPAAESVVAKEEILYYPILPPLTTNFSDDSGRRRFMQVSLEVMAHDRAVIDSVKEHNAVLRNALLLAFSEIDYEGVVTREGKEALRALALDEVRTVLRDLTGEPGVEDVYFTGFVVQ